MMMIKRSLVLHYYLAFSTNKWMTEWMNERMFKWMNDWITACLLICHNISLHSFDMNFWSIMRYTMSSSIISSRVFINGCRCKQIVSSFTLSISIRPFMWTFVLLEQCHKWHMPTNIFFLYYIPFLPSAICNFYSRLVL